MNTKHRPAVGDQKKIGEMILKRRSEIHMTQGMLAKTLGTSQSAVARMENGEQNFSTEMIAKISRAIKKDIITLSNSSMNFSIICGKKIPRT